MSWRCPEPTCRYDNYDSDKTCQNPDCPTNPDNRKNDHWWRCGVCQKYNYMNQPWCEKCGASQDKAEQWGQLEAK